MLAEDVGGYFHRLWRPGPGPFARIVAQTPIAEGHYSVPYFTIAATASGLGAADWWWRITRKTASVTNVLDP